VGCRSRSALAAALLAVAGCKGAVDRPDWITDGGGYLGDAAARPLAIVGDRVSDWLELYQYDPKLVEAARLSVDEHPEFINEPFDLALSPDGAALYVVLGHPDMYHMGTLLKARLGDGSRIAEIPLGEEPSMIALSPDGTRAYVSLFRNLGHPQGPWTAPGALVVVDTVNMRVLGVADVCAAALGVALDEARERVWVACLGGDALALVDVANDAPRVEQMVPLGAGTAPAYVLLDDAHAFVTASGSGELIALDRADATVAKRIAFGSDAFPQRMALAGDLVLVCVDDAQQLAAISRAALEPVDTVATPGMHPQGIAVTRDGRYALFTDENDLLHPGQVVRVDLAGLGSGGAHVDATAPTRVFPQAVIVAP